jgi:hypothetical protein
MIESLSNHPERYQLKLFEYSPLITEEEIRIADYSLKLDDFSKDHVPTAIKKWEYPLPVSRDNYIPYTVAVFGFSKGSPAIHAMYMHLIKERTGFDGFASNKAFMAAGGWNTLSPEEQAYFEEAFTSVARHGAGRRYEAPGNKYRNVGEELLDNLPTNPTFGLTYRVLGKEQPINFQQSDKDIFSFLKRKRKEEAMYRALQID